MSGHSKWAQIKRKKAVVDSKRGASFTKVARLITMAARRGGGNPDGNATLRLAILKAKEANMPNDNIQRAIKKGTGEDGGAQLEEVTYEAYAAHGVGLLVECLTDNTNRTLPEIRLLLEKHGGSLASKGAVAYNFSKKGIFLFAPGTLEEKVMEVAIDAGAEDIASQPDASVEVQTDPGHYEAVLKALNQGGLKPESSELTLAPGTRVELDAAATDKVLRLIDVLEEHDDVQNVFHNAHFPDA